MVSPSGPAASPTACVPLAPALIRPGPAAKAAAEEYLRQAFLDPSACLEDPAAFAVAAAAAAAAARLVVCCPRMRSGGASKPAPQVAAAPPPADSDAIAAAFAARVSRLGDDLESALGRAIRFGIAPEDACRAADEAAEAYCREATSPSPPGSAADDSKPRWRSQATTLAVETAERVLSEKSPHRVEFPLEMSFLWHSEKEDMEGTSNWIYHTSDWMSFFGRATVLPDALTLPTLPGISYGYATTATATILGNAFNAVSLQPPFKGKIESSQVPLRPATLVAAVKAATRAFLGAVEAERAATLPATAYNSDPDGGPLLLHQTESVLMLLVNSVHTLR